MAKKLNVLVTGATGQQGGAVARQLLRKGHRVLGLTRNPQSAAAQELQRLGAEPVRGNLEDRGSLEQALRGIDAVFAVSVPFESGVEAETQQGITLADAAKAAGVAHLVFTSVPKADRFTGIPHFDSKTRVEQHIKQIGVPHTIIGPTFFMENLLSPWWLPGLRQGQFAIALSPNRKLEIIATEDIGAFAAHVIEKREEFLGRRIDIAGDTRTPVEMAEIVSRASGRKIEYVQTPIEQVRQWSEDFALMFEFFEREGLGIDVAGLRRKYPEVGWHTLEEWARKQKWEAALGEAA